MTEQEFRNKYVGKAVHCNTEEKAKELLKLADCFGWKWNGGHSLIEETFWRFYEEEACYRIGNDKRILRSGLHFYKSQGWEIVEFESEEKKVKKTKKVFDLGLFVDSMRNQKRSNEEIMGAIQQWALECHGLTKEEMSKKGWNTHDIWMKEVEVKAELTAQEIEVLKALKFLGFEWIARDSDDELYAHISKPNKNSFSYGKLDHSCYLNKDLFKFVTWEDEEATEIEELLCGLQ